MSNLNDAHFPAGSASFNPRVREEMAARMRKFHKEVVGRIGQVEMLKVYCHALSNWVLNPNTDPYQIEMLFDEICHAAQAEDLEGWDI